MTSRPWLEHYPEGVAADLGALGFDNIPAMIRHAASEYATTTAFTQCMPNGMNGSLSYAQVDALSDDFAEYLREVVGLAQGDRVAVQMPNCLSYPVVAFGVFKAGCVLVNTNPLYTASEMSKQFADSGAKALVVIDMFADRLPEVLPATDITTVVTVKIAEFFPPIIAGVIRMVQKVWNRSLPPITVPHTGLQTALAEGRKRKSDTAAGDYLTGVGPDSLAALQYTGGTTGVAKGAMLSHGNLVANTRQMVTMCGTHMRAGVEVVLTALPLYHVFAFTVNLLGFYHLGARNILVPSPRPPSNLKRAFENYKITWLTGVNTLFNALLNERWFETAVGTPGELLARGPQIMLGYWRKPDETAATLTDGWLRTGDIAQMDDEGYFTIVDRKKDMILVSGFNVYPNEIEECIAAMPGVTEVGVVGILDDTTGEAVRAYIVAENPAPTDAEVIAHCRQTLAGYKVPKSVRFVDELPKSPIGKILRRELRDSVTATIRSQPEDRS